MQDLRDILLEVEDLGYEAEISAPEIREFNYSIIIYRPDAGIGQKSIRYADLKDCLLRLKDYLGDKYIGCGIYETDRWVKFPLIDCVLDRSYLYDWSKIIGISIEFKRI